MAQFRVGLVQTVFEESTVYVEAENREAAEALALAQANEGTVEWRFLESSDPIEVVSADQVETANPQP